MQCSLCNGKTKVLTTRRSDKIGGVLNIPVRYQHLVDCDFIYRSHSCECGNVFESIEMDVDEVVKIHKVARQHIVGKIMDLLVRL